MSEEKVGISRREFARRVAVASAAAVTPVGVFAGTAAELTPEAPAEARTALAQAAQAPGVPTLSAAGQAEVSSRVDAILKLYGGRFSEAQKADLQRLSVLAQGQLDHVRAYAVDNGDGAALYLKPLMEREKVKK